MPPKLSKKTIEKEKAKIIEDKTFGLKNKNRSAKVQKFVQSVQQNVKNKFDQRFTDMEHQKELEKKRQAKAEKIKFEAEMQALFKAVKPEGGEKAEGVEEGEEEDKNFGCAPEEYLWRPEDFEEVEQDTRRLEEQLEDERAKLQGRTDLTPVTEESFQAWKKKKREEAAEAERQRLLKGKKDGTLRGWDLWLHDQSLFVDDADAEELYEREEYEEEQLDEDGGAAGQDAPRARDTQESEAPQEDAPACDPPQ